MNLSKFQYLCAQGLESHFNPEIPFSRFFRNILLLSCFNILPLLLIFILLSSGFLTILATNATAFIRFNRQVLSNGVLVVFVINYIGFFSAKALQTRLRQHPVCYLFLDGCIRAILFIALHALVYVISADLFGSFGGDRLTALQVVGPTLQRAYAFENISSVYLYGTLVGSYALYIAVLAPRKSAQRWRAHALSISTCASTLLAVTFLSNAARLLFEGAQ